MVALSCALLLFETGCGGHDSQIATKAVGWWQETGTTRTYTLHVTAAEANKYTIEYRRHFLVPFDATLRDGKIVVVDMSRDMLTLTYDPKTDELRAESPTYPPVTLVRIAKPQSMP